MDCAELVAVDVGREDDALEVVEQPPATKTKTASKAPVRSR
jgi:hypothetical protein